MSTGDIRGPYAHRAKEYIWSTLAEVFPRGITPSDFDGVVEINRCFFVFEGKTKGKEVDTGQGLCLKRAIEAWPSRRAVLVLGEHPRMEKVDTRAGIISVRYGFRDGDRFRWLPYVVTGPSPLWEVALEFVKDAESRGVLDCASWQQRMEHGGRPFSDAAA